MANWDFAYLLEMQWIDGEEREFHILPVGQSLYVVVTTERIDKVRIISLRLAETHENEGLESRVSTWVKSRR